MNVLRGRFAVTALFVILLLTRLIAGWADDETSPPLAPPPSFTLSPFQAAKPVATPDDYMSVLCDLFRQTWAGWRAGKEVTPEMDTFLEYLTRDGSKLKKDAESFRRLAHLNVSEMEGLDTVIDLQFAYLTSRCYQFD